MGERILSVAGLAGAVDAQDDNVICSFRIGRVRFEPVEYSMFLADKHPCARFVSFRMGVGRRDKTRHSRIQPAQSSRRSNARAGLL